MKTKGSKSISVYKKSKKAKSWHWHSTPQTFEKMEISILSLIESIFAIVLYSWIAIEGYTFHIIVSACVAPFLLLRTRDSTALALNTEETIVKRFLDPIVDFVDEIDLIPDMIKYPLAWTFVAPLSAMMLLVIKLWATSLSVIKNPIKSLLEMPRNWWKIVGCIDVFHPPEPLPGYLNRKKQHSWSKYDLLVEPIMIIPAAYRRKPSDAWEWALALFVVPLILLFVALPAILYRWSLKGSSVIYLPLLWVVRTTGSGNAESRMNEVKELSFQKLRRWLGMLIILMLASKIFLIEMWNNLDESLLSADPYGFVGLFIAPLEIPRWQIASAINGLIAWFTLFLAESALIEIKQNRSPVGLGYIFAARFLWFVGSILTLYTLSVLLYNVGTLQWGLLPIGENWFPWKSN